MRRHDPAACPACDGKPQAQDRPTYHIKEEEITTLADLLHYIRRYEDGIYVRAEVNGKWSAYALTELTPRLWAEKVARFIEQGVLPVRVREESELREEKDERHEG